MKSSYLVVLAVGLALVLGAMPAAADTWTDYDDIGPDLLSYENTYPSLCKRYDLGFSYEGRHLWAIRISDNVLVEEDEPEFKYIATMHGDEIVGTKMSMMLIDYLLTNYGIDPQATNIIDEVELWIVPLMNPDGYDSSPRTRRNAQNIDLNRNFPEGAGNDPDPNTPDGRATETQVIMNWSFGQSFTASANFHGGALVVSYAFDNDGIGSVYSPTPDDDLFVYISKLYSHYNSPMWNDPDPGYATDGIINGADWYAINGGMQDWNYRYMGCNEVTIELSKYKQPSASQIPTFWDDNRVSMMTYIETCLIGVRGLVTDASTAAPLAATATVAGRDHEVYTDPDVGDYHRMLLPGVYDLTFKAEGFDPVVETGVLVTIIEATVLNIELHAAPQIVSPDSGETLTAGVETTVTWTGNPEAQFHVQHTENYGTPETTIWTDIIALTAPGAMSTPWTPANPGEDHKVRVRSYLDGTYGDWDESDGTFSVNLPPADGDYDNDEDVDLADFAQFQACFGATPPSDCAEAFDFEPDGDVDLDDFAEFETLLTGP